MSRPTLTRKLFFRITPTILITMAIIGGFAFNSATREINNVYDAQLINDANVLWMLLHNQFDEEPGDAPPKQIADIDFNMGNQLALNEDADDYADAHMFRAWKENKIVLFSGSTFPAEIPLQRAGFTNVHYDSEQWRIYSLPIPETQIVIEVAEKIAMRQTLVSNILLNLIFPLLILIPLIALLIWFGINSGLSTIRMLVQQIRSRSPDDLSAIPVDTLPRDLSPLGRSINQLLEDLDDSLKAERRFADHAAHQLRTPQAALKLLLQMLSQADSEKERQAILADLVISNEKATYLIEQLLRAARVGHQPMQLQPVALYSTVASIVAEMGNLITAKRLDMSLDGDEKALVRADDPLLRLMVSNLIENAVKYTPAGGRIRVGVTLANNFWQLSISDSGPGIAEHHREAVFQRFYRIDTPQIEGTGLGLTIVADIIKRLSGTIALKSPASGKGLLVEVLLPKA
ncbi:HAMP domain-containing sensor histidine kinase [Phyllobacterium sp. P30BS-XVII]|uniref:sensor histidine kinase n=1 Tax=Phyllobacterium sp. P30BS-XVII TaxID=2587046 RepID=UPI0015FCC8CB|nr:HAMP domain-containing sensor histidine kinase [Phyllobacterium sp. P30BS-XVII]MBA8902628.1 two-component system sensor histidine kinase QseC [Phyllobacterium sp. P30BS-XVII]